VDDNGDYKRVTFNTAPEAADEIYVINPGRTTSVFQVSDNSIITSMLQDDAVTSAKIADNTIVNANINSSAAIAYSKLNLATSIANSDISSSAAIAYSKLNLATSIANSDISSSAAIAYSKLNLASSITTSDLATGITTTHGLGSASTPSITFTGDTNTGIFSPTADTIAFTEGGTEAMRINSSGNVGIGTSNPADKLDVNGNAFVRGDIQVQTHLEVGKAGLSGNRSALVDLTGDDVYSDFGLRLIRNNGGQNTDSALIHRGTGALYLETVDSGLIIFRTVSVNRMAVHTNGNVEIVGNLDMVGGGATVRIHLGGGAPTDNNTGIAAAWNTHSDYRLKENITPFTSALSIVNNLKPITFTWKGEENKFKFAGFLAHELAEQLPYAVIGEKDAVNQDGSIISQGADYSKVVPLLVASIKELQTLINTQQETIKSLEARITTLENKKWPT
jgi:hypothetical protein